MIQPAARNRGRKRIIHTASSDFLLHDAWAAYTDKLAEIRAADKAKRLAAKQDGRILPRSSASPCLRAADFVAGKMSKELKNISGKRLLTAFSETKKLNMSDAEYRELIGDGPPDADF